MADTTGAAELRAAAAKLFAAATAAQEDVDSNDYWSCYEAATAWRDGLVNGFGGTPGDLAGMCTPAFVITVARWLDQFAATKFDPGAGIQVTDRSHELALAVARSINNPTDTARQE
jgi:hypothetical protein